MPVQLAILGALIEGKSYGYEIKKTIEQKLAGCYGIKFGSIYFALDKMVKSGLVQRVKEERVAGRPARLLYRITPRGRDKFVELAEKTLLMVKPPLEPVDLVLSFVHVVGRSRLEDLLRKRIENIGIEEQHLHEICKLHEGNELWREIVLPIINHALEHLRVERKWAKLMLERVRKREIA